MSSDPTLRSASVPRANSVANRHDNSATPATLIELVNAWAERSPERPAVSYFNGSSEQTLSFAELVRQARTLATTLRQHDLHGQRVLLSCPLGLDFVRGFLACLYAGAVAVPAPFGRSKSMKARLTAIVRDCEPGALLTIGESGAPAGAADDPLAGLRVFRADHVPTFSEAGPCPWPQPAPNALAFLQYTSGSTSEPKGTAITHANIVANQRMLEELFGTSRDSVVVSWLPLFHDMGLIGMLLHALYLGARVVLLPTLAVLKEPLLWLHAISRFGGTFSAAPNFAYDLCVDKTSSAQRAGLYLGRWRTAVNGSEPVRHGTAQRFLAAFASAGFRASSFAPAYGLAEATLVVSASVARPPTFLALDAKSLNADIVKAPNDVEQARWLVGCGRFDLGDQSLRIVDPHRLVPLSDGQIGEIWLAGSHVAEGYFQRPAATAERFGARLPADERRYLRTGDLGFVKDSELFVTGRLKELIIVRGQNFYPQDIEATVEDASPCVRRGSVAAFGLDVGDEQGLVVMAEVERREQATPELVLHLVQALRESHDVALRHLRIVAKGSVHKTTSGKIQRTRCRQDYLEGRSNAYVEWAAPTISSQLGDQGELSQTVEAHARKWLSKRLAVDFDAVDPRASFATFGLDSISRVELLQAVEQRFGRNVPEAVAHRLDSIHDLAGFFETQTSAVPAAPAALQPERALTGREPSSGASQSAEPAEPVLPAFSALPWNRTR